MSLWGREKPTLLSLWALISVSLNAGQLFPHAAPSSWVLAALEHCAPSGHCPLPGHRLYAHRTSGTLHAPWTLAFTPLRSTLQEPRERTRSPRRLSRHSSSSGPAGEKRPLPPRPPPRSGLLAPTALFPRASPLPVPAASGAPARGSPLPRKERDRMRGWSTTALCIAPQLCFSPWPGHRRLPWPAGPS